MTQLVKASLCEVAADARGTEIGTPIDVQFNPTSLRMQITNKTGGGQQAGSQSRQRPGDGVVTLTFELVFDTCDEGTTAAPVPVTRKTMVVENFVRPRGNTPRDQAPARVQFKWGSFLVQGTMESVSVDLDLFAADGTPLRAKVGVTIKGQDPRYQYDPLPAPSAQPPGPLDPPAGAPGTSGGRTPERVAQAMPGESLAQMAARNGLDPNAWRAMAAGVGNPLSLPAGLEVGLPDGARVSSLSGGGGQGGDLGLVAASLPLVGGSASGSGGGQAPAAGRTGGAGDNGGAGTAANPVRAGQAIVRQGGMSGAIGQVHSAGQRYAASATQSAFGLAHGAGAELGERPFGAGVPMRPQRGGTPPPLTVDATTPAWQALRAGAGGTNSTVTRLGRRTPGSCGCACGGKKG
ncbi:CIS tube protein [Pseudoduganella namucuonensis]|uniref:Contractile injection system tube protein N-terminal domain-containing protein n=1 Tax=Pseudoduganella namucuonensis TaxID=1035707 RepID=A0A1I7HFI9_9BURK|nr:hypothetical protein [Pseudoduganella namucuonensis]SFU59490.1 hypothetical protein SAMN05216552_1005234 [Pseudoduganella namucuonensis]